MKAGTVPINGASIGAALKAQRAELGMSQEEFAKRARIPLDSYKKYEGGGIVPGGEALAKLAAAGVDLERLLLGRSTRPGPLRAEQPRGGYAYVPLLDVRAKAGAAGAIVEGEAVVDVLAFKEDWVRHELRASPDDLRLIYIEGDSMEPDLRPGDIAMVNRADAAVRRDSIYAIHMDGALLVKALQRLPGGKVRVISRNPAYQSFDVAGEQLEQGGLISIVGRVVWVCRRV